ncbi:MAG: hypothetical protein Q8P30_01610 [Candidatus Uhrbacteria bacterium]|nr:hypothetical protein [Candidatus Uhrbacteria bacterium]
MEITLYPGSVELFFEVLNTAIAIGAIIFSLVLASMMRGGALSKTWGWMATGVIFFGLLEFYGLLSGLDIFVAHGLSEVLEFLAVISFLVAFMLGWKNLKSK